MGALLTGQIETFVDHGYADFAVAVDPAACGRLSATIRRERCEREAIFVAESAFRDLPVIAGNNPRPGRNYLERHDDSFAERLPQLDEFLMTVLGAGYQLLVKKVVCSLPSSWVPAWVHAEVARTGFRNLNAYVADGLKDVTYFLGQDFHQDLIDYRDRTADFLTVYLYLDAVAASDSPLIILPDSHRAGAQLFPHRLERMAPGTWRFTPDGAPPQALTELRLVGPAGSLYAWHACILHATLPNTSSAPRVSLRYLFSKGEGAGRALIDDVNRRIEGALRLDRTRTYQGEEVLGDTLVQHFPEITRR